MKILRNIIYWGGPTLLLCGLFTPLVSFAQEASSTGFIPLTQLPGLTTTAGASSLPVFFNSLYKLCIGAAAVIAVLQIMRAGVMFMTSRGSVSSNSEAKSLIQNSIIGLVLVLSPYIVFSIINPNILKLDLNVGGLGSKYEAIDPNAIPVAGENSFCKAYNQFEIESGASCKTGWTKITDVKSCSQASGACGSLNSGQSCCARTADTYLLAYTFTITPKPGTNGNVCTMSTDPQYFSTEKQCKDQAASLPGFISAGASNYSYSNLKVLKSCEFTTKTPTYVMPSSPNACPT